MKYYRYRQLSTVSKKRAEEVYKREQGLHYDKTSAMAVSALEAMNELYRYDEFGNFLGTKWSLARLAGAMD